MSKAQKMEKLQGAAANRKPVKIKIGRHVIRIQQYRR